MTTTALPIQQLRESTERKPLMNAIELLKHDHEVVKKLLTELSDTTERAVKKRTELLRRIELELTQHTAIEEEIFYPALPRAEKLLDHPTLDRLASAMQQMKKDIKAHWDKRAA